MARRGSRIRQVIEFLEEAKKTAIREEEKASKEKRYHFAEVYNSFVAILERVLELCGGEKPKEKKEIV